MREGRTGRGSFHAPRWAWARAGRRAAATLRGRITAHLAMFWLGLTLYCVNVLMGLAAQLGHVRFGIWHHVLYALVFASAVAAAIWAFHPALLVTLAALAVFPKARPRTVWHPTLALVGLLGYLVAWAAGG